MRGKMLSNAEKKIKGELLEKYAHELELSPLEAMELRKIVEKDDKFDKGSKLLILRALGNIVGYALAKAK